MDAKGAREHAERVVADRRFYADVDGHLDGIRGLVRDVVPQGKWELILPMLDRRLGLVRDVITTLHMVTGDLIDDLERVDPDLNDDLIPTAA